MGSFPGEWLTSDFIAGSLNSHAALVRKELGALRNAGLVESREGKNGGSRLARPLADIRLSEVFSLVKEEHIFGFSPNDPNPSCPIGKNINKALDTLFTGIDETVGRELDQVSLDTFIQKNF